jgi:hypothetical protein
VNVKELIGLKPACSNDYCLVETTNSTRAASFNNRRALMANKEQKSNPNNKKVAKLSLKEKRLKKQEKKKH